MEARDGVGGPAEIQLGDLKSLVTETVLWEPMDDISPEILEAQGE